VGLLTLVPLRSGVPRSSREIVRTAVGLAALAPAGGLFVLAVILMRDGGAGVFAGLFVGLLAVGLLAVAFMMTYAPVTIGNLLGDDGDDEPPQPDTDGRPPEPDERRPRP